MDVLGIIAEYNPFHNGHLYHLNKSKEKTGADTTVAVMSGDFVQRGEPAVIDKWKRSEMAVQNGVDLVLELPFAFAANNAEIFAKGSVQLLDGLGIVDYICFGTEEGVLDPLFKLAHMLSDEPVGFTDILKEKMKEGMSYPKARQEVLTELTGSDTARLLQSPNNILGIEYLKQLKIIRSGITPFTIKRKGAMIDEANKAEKTAGATAIRNMIDEGDLAGVLEYLPPESSKIMGEASNVFSDLEMFREVIFYSILSRTEDELAGIYPVKEGLENKIKASAKEASSVKQLIEMIKSKRYTETRIKRILLHILLGLSSEKMNKIIDENQIYARVLAFNDKGSVLLKRIKKDDSSKIPIITNISKESDMFEKSRDLFEYDILSSDIYNLVTSNEVYRDSDYRKIPAYVR